MWILSRAGADVWRPTSIRLSLLDQARKQRQHRHNNAVPLHIDYSVHRVAASHRIEIIAGSNPYLPRLP